MNELNAEGKTTLTENLNGRAKTEI